MATVEKRGRRQSASQAAVDALIAVWLAGAVGGKGVRA